MVEEHDPQLSLFESHSARTLLPLLLIAGQGEDADDDGRVW